jgi:hypothetical protein
LYSITLQKVLQGFQGIQLKKTREKIVLRWVNFMGFTFTLGCLCQKWVEPPTKQTCQRTY